MRRHGPNAEQDLHHPWCGFVADPAKGCASCADLRARYPFRPGETSAEATARFFPQRSRTEPEPRPATALVMVERGREMIAATAPMVEAHATAVKEPLAEIEELLRQRQQHLARLASRQSAERSRIAKVRDAMGREARRRVGNAVVEIDGETTTVKRVKTTIGKMEKEGKLPADLAMHVYAFARRVAEGMGVATEDEHDSTNRLTGPYSPVATLSGFGSKTLADSQIVGLSVLRAMSRRVPAELRPIFEQIVEEEIIGQSRLGRTLGELGEALGYKHKQQIPAGGALVYATVALIAHFMRDSRLGAPDPSRHLRTLGG